MASNNPATDSEGPESRFDALNGAVDKTLEKIAQFFSNKFMSKCYSSIAVKYPETLEQLRNTLISGILKRVKDDLDQFYCDLSLKEKLDVIDKLKDEQDTLSSDEKVWRPTGIPARDMLAHDLPLMMSYKEHLQSCVSEVEAAVEDKKETLTKIVDEIRKEEEGMKSILEKNQQTISTLQSIVRIYFQ